MCNQEYDLHLRLAGDGVTFVHLDETLATVRRQPNSVSSNSERLLLSLPEVYWYSYERLRERGRLTGDRAERFAGRMALTGRGLVGLGRLEEARQCFEDARRMHPSGGQRSAYDTKSRWLRRLVGPVRAEQVIRAYRRVAGRSRL